ncbi:MAG: hypothetical protein HZA17_10275 [Nitrospirae bacterium]|nr:hypothetical protein [Nitrospirota bacterium]
MRKKTTVTACRIPDEHYEKLKSLASDRNVTVGTFLRVLVREFLSNGTGVRLH